MPNDQNDEANMAAAQHGFTQSPEALAEEIRMAIENEDGPKAAMLMARSLIALESIAHSLKALADQGAKNAGLLKT